MPDFWLLIVALLVGAWMGMSLMAVLLAGKREDETMELERMALRGACCNHDCNQGRDCPVRNGGGA